MMGADSEVRPRLQGYLLDNGDFTIYDAFNEIGAKVSAGHSSWNDVDRKGHCNRSGCLRVVGPGLAATRMTLGLEFIARLPEEFEAFLKAELRR